MEEVSGVATRRSTPGRIGNAVGEKGPVDLSAAPSYQSQTAGFFPMVRTNLSPTVANGFIGGPRLPFVYLALAALAGLPASGQVPNANLRPTRVVLIVSNSRLYSGTYQASGIARACGTVDLGFPNRIKSFTVEFPDDEPDLPVRALSFDAENLPVGTATTRFHLAVGISGPKVGKPPQFVVNSARAGSRETGTAELKEKDGVTTLTLTGIDAMGVRLELTVVAQPGKQ
jgi:hypothetical protein